MPCGIHHLAMPIASLPHDAVRFFYFTEVHMREPVNHSDDGLIKMVDKWSNRLMIVVVLIPFIVSFGALQDLASANGVNYPFMYPLMIDLSLIIFNLVALRSSLHGERNLYAWALVLMATIISVALNVVHAPRTVLAMFMAALPPLFILAAFHLVVTRIEHSARRNKTIISLEKLRQNVAVLESEIEQLTVQKETLTREISSKDEQIANLSEQITNYKNELDHLEREQSQNESIVTRQEKLHALLNESETKLTQAELAEKLGVSISTVRRDLQSLNGKVS